MRSRKALGGATVVTVWLGTLFAFPAIQTPPVRAADEKVLREYTGVYRWEPDAFVYLQLWNEFTGFDKPSQLVSFDESGEIRSLYPTDRDQFFAGPGAAMATSIESRIEFQRDSGGRIISLSWGRDGGVPRTASRVEIEKREDVRFANGSVQLAGMLISPAIGGTHPAIILVHGSGAENREYMLPWVEYAAAQDALVAKMGPAPDTIPGSPDHPYWQFIRRLYFYDPVPTLRQLQTPALALWGELDNNIVADKNKAAWEAALEAGGNRDYTLAILPKANHAQLEAKVGSNAEMKSLQRFVPRYYTTIQDWCAKRIRGFITTP
jgi:hypothetical protein